MPRTKEAMVYHWEITRHWDGMWPNASHELPRPIISNTPQDNASLDEQRSAQTSFGQLASLSTENNSLASLAQTSILEDNSLRSDIDSTNSSLPLQTNNSL
jgi:hypothetical protein